MAGVDWADRSWNAMWMWGLEKGLGFRVGYQVYNVGSVVITGAGSGIGADAAKTLAQEGYTVFAGVRNLEDGKRLQEQLSFPVSENIVPILLDVTNPTHVSRAGELVRTHLSQHSALQPLIAIVNCAGIPCVSPIETISPSQMRQCLEVNVIGPVRVCQEFIPLLRESGGRVINVGSAAGFMACPLNGGYAASKMALEALSDSLRVEMQSWGLSVSVIEPGAVDTKLWSECSDPSKPPSPSEPLYSPLLISLKSLTAETRQCLISPRHTTRAILHAIKDRYPKTRYLVGYDARCAAFMRAWIPDRVLDWAFWLVLGESRNP
ncbi:hypothetical protein SpCBS45565_g03873 [Spizellomyces sp. 'palustris']|nr:hypothetical protein SpCBS45565_g03873 [Spizellomyces sp. 'palustris']